MKRYWRREVNIEDGGERREGKGTKIREEGNGIKG